MNDHCVGCISYIASKYDLYCLYSRYSTNGECPCSECVIKVMCKDPCNEFENFRVRIVV